VQIGIDQAIQVINEVRKIPGVSGVHLMGMGHDETVRAVVEKAGLFPRPVPPR
jgi:methylenetetrahydrofolate reductase (NADPH)